MNLKILLKVKMEIFTVFEIIKVSNQSLDYGYLVSQKVEILYGIIIVIVLLVLVDQSLKLMRKLFFVAVLKD